MMNEGSLCDFFQYLDDAWLFWVLTEIKDDRIPDHMKGCDRCYQRSELAKDNLFGTAEQLP
jgi:hypothetical protein